MADIQHHPLPWWEAPIPRRWHRCKAATSGYVAHALVERCACGGIRLGAGRWFDRNTRERGTASPIILGNADAVTQLGGGARRKTGGT